MNEFMDGDDTSVFFACKNMNPELAEYLIESGAEVNVKNYRGETPLHEACRHKNHELVELLIRSGADVYAMKPPAEKCIEYLKSYIISRLQKYEEALIVHSWHPKRLLKWCE